jgi:enoyl-CoA hydratase/carnithine racemase
MPRCAARREGSMTAHVIVTDEGPIRTIRMNRPEKKNALTFAMYDAMAEAITSAGGASPIRCLVICGAPGAFSAGNDLGDFMKAATGGAGLGSSIINFLHTLARCERPLVAAVTGVAVGIGTTMMLHCDYAVSASDARFTTPFVALGLIPEAASSLLAPRLMGHRRAFELLVMGKPFSGEEAKAAGLVNQVAPADRVEAEALKAAQAIAALPPEGVAISRRLMKGVPDEIMGRIDEEAAAFSARLQSAEARAAFAAFFARKK